MCLFLLLRAGSLTPTTSSSDHGSPCCTDEAETSSGRLSPRPAQTPLGRFILCASKGPGGRTRVLSFRRNELLPRTPSRCVFFCYYAPGLSHPLARQVTMVHHAARMRQPDTSGVNSIYLHSINKEETPLGAAGGVSGDCYQSARFLMPLLYRRIQARQKRRPP